MPASQPLRRAAWLLAVLALAAGCGGADPPPAAAPPGSSASAPPTAGAQASLAPTPAVPSSAPAPSDGTSSGPAPGPAPGSLPGSGAAVRAVPACRTDQLDLTVEAPAEDVLLLLLTNRSGAPCSVEGHPGVSLLDDGQQQVFYPATEHADQAQVVVLDPGAVSNALLTAESLTCEVAPPSSFVRLVPPGQSEPLVAPAELAACATMVSAVHPGRVSPLRAS